MFNGPLVVGERNVEKLKTMKEKERERDVEALRSLEMCHVCIKREREKNLVLLYCAAAATAGWKKKFQLCILMI